MYDTIVDYDPTYGRPKKSLPLMTASRVGYSMLHMRDMFHSKNPSLPPSRTVNAPSYNRNFRTVHGPDRSRKVYRLAFGD